jgi:recombinase, phage RecT family
MTEEKKPDYALVIYDKKIKERFLECVDEKTYNKEIIFAKQAFDNSEALQKCSTASIRAAIVNIALTGASLNPALQQAFLIPRKGKCCLDFSYRGLCKIAVDSDSVYDIDATAVFEDDDFDYEMGLYPRLVHKPKMHPEEDKPIVKAAYAIATLHHGIKKFVVLDREKIDRARKSAQYDTVWKLHFDEMAKKTAVKLLYKLLPQTERMSVAVKALNEHEGIKEVTAAEKLIEKFEEKKEEMPVVECPDGNVMVEIIVCEDCDHRKGCPAWIKTDEDKD